MIWSAKFERWIGNLYFLEPEETFAEDYSYGDKEVNPENYEYQSRKRDDNIWMEKVKRRFKETNKGVRGCPNKWNVFHGLLLFCLYRDTMQINFLFSLHCILPWTLGRRTEQTIEELQGALQSADRSLSAAKVLGQRLGRWMWSLLLLEQDRWPRLMAAPKAPEGDHWKIRRDSEKWKGSTGSRCDGRRTNVAAAKQKPTSTRSEPLSTTSTAPKENKITRLGKDSANKERPQAVPRNIRQDRSDGSRFIQWLWKGEVVIWIERRWRQNRRWLNCFWSAFPTAPIPIAWRSSASE